MKARCVSCGHETWLRQPRGFRLEFQRCRCGGSYSRVSDAYDSRPCRGDAYEPVSPRHHAPACHACAKSERRGGKCADRLHMMTAEDWEAEVEEMETRLRGRARREDACR